MGKDMMRYMIMRAWDGGYFEWSHRWSREFKISTCDFGRRLYRSYNVRFRARLTGGSKRVSLYRRAHHVHAGVFPWRRGRLELYSAWAWRRSRRSSSSSSISSSAGRPWSE